MPSDIAKEIVNRIFGDDKAGALDATNDAFSSYTYDLIQQKKLEFAKTMGFDLEDTAQEVADELADELPTGDESPEDVDVDGRMPHDPPEELNTTEEEETDETYQ